MSSSTIQRPRSAADGAAPIQVIIVDQGNDFLVINVDGSINIGTIVNNVNVVIVSPIPTGDNVIGRVRITDESGTDIAQVMASAPTGSEQGLVVRNIPSGTQTVAPPAEQLTSGTVSNAGESITQTLSAGHFGASIRILGTWIGTLNFEASVDNAVTYASIFVNSYTGEVVFQTAVNGHFSVANLSGVTHIRVTANPWTSGTANIHIRGESGLNALLPLEDSTPAPAAVGVITRNIPGGTQVVSGVVTANAGTGTFTVDPTDRIGRLMGTLAHASRGDGYVGTGAGPSVDASAFPLNKFALSVVGTGGVPTSWDVRLEGSLDNANWTQILQHVTATGNGATVWSGTILSPSRYFRSRVAALVLGPAANILVTILGMQ